MRLVAPAQSFHHGLNIGALYYFGGFFIMMTYSNS